MFLLDTMVLSELRKTSPNRNVRAWVNNCDDNKLFLSVVSIGEIQRGIKQQLTKNPVFSRNLSQWLKNVIKVYGNRIIPITNEIAVEWGNISARTGNSGADNFIAATAKVHSFTVITRNVKHFELTGVPVKNPWEYSNSD